MGALSSVPSKPPGRQRVALKKPKPAQVSGFPRTRLTSRRSLYRAHREWGPWWFASDGGGRFDLSPPLGICYLATSPADALREALGRLVDSGVVVDEELANRFVSNLHVPATQVADTTDPDAANHGVTKEISTITPYRLPQLWAQAWADDGCGGVRYLGRFSTDPKGRCYALFGPAGVGSWSEDPSPVLAIDVAVAAGMEVVSRPAPRRVTFISPPGP